ncbi:hypothetical protein KP509_25G045000 [Ceratopteris richardii]|nr:hypothetical protein KP509_25G045000 [Ceratopteris richardii]
MIKLYGKPIRVNKASQDKKSLDVGANLFIGNLDPDVDEKLLYDTFSAFGVIVTNPKIMRDPDSGNSRGFGFISYDSFEASDAAIDAMGGQYLCNRPITVSYAFKKDTKGERHGTPAERMLASNNPNVQKNRPHTLFASGPPSLAGPPSSGPPSMPMQPLVPPPPISVPFTNGPLNPMSALQRPAPPQVPISPFMGQPGAPQMPGGSTWPNQAAQQGQGMPQITQQQFRPPPPASRPTGIPNMPAPPQGFTVMRPPPPVTVSPPVWRGPPPPTGQGPAGSQPTSQPQSAIPSQGMPGMPFAQPVGMNSQQGPLPPLRPPYVGQGAPPPPRTGVSVVPPPPSAS